MASFTLVGRQRHAEVLMPAIDELCRQAGWAVADLTGVAVDRGPGLFTGLRVGLATARAIATACRVPAAGVTSLEVLAHSAGAAPACSFPWWTPGGGRSTGRCTTLTAPMRTSCGRRRSPARRRSPSSWPSSTAPVLAVGDGAVALQGGLLNTGGRRSGRSGEMWPSALGRGRAAP